MNQRLGEIDRMEVTKEKIKTMLKQYEYPIYSQSYHQFSRENQARYEENVQKLKEADQLLQHFEQKENLDDILDDIDSQYRELEQEIKTFAEMDAKELKRIEGERLKRKLREVEALQRENEES